MLYIKNFATSETNNKLLVVGRKILNLTDLYTDPVESSLLDIYKGEGFSELDVWPITNIGKKCMLLTLPTSSNVYAIIPILHSEGLDLRTKL